MIFFPKGRVAGKPQVSLRSVPQMKAAPLDLSGTLLVMFESFGSHARLSWAQLAVCAAIGAGGALVVWWLTGIGALVVIPLGVALAAVFVGVVSRTFIVSSCAVLAGLVGIALGTALLVVPVAHTELVFLVIAPSAALAFPILAIAHALRRRVRALTPTGRCAECGYDLLGLSANTPCPECGAARAQVREYPADPVPRDG
jgi:hypothetical protein